MTDDPARQGEASPAHCPERPGLPGEAELSYGLLKGS